MNLLFENVTTDALDLPRVSGIEDAKRLLFKNNASMSFSKSSGGRGPSKLLYLMSRYFRFGHERTTEGNSPTRRLLLRSNSYMRVRFLKLSGMTPQNLLELTWKRAMSVKRPNSTGKYPEIRGIQN